MTRTRWKRSSLMESVAFKVMTAWDTKIKGQAYSGGKEVNLLMKGAKAHNQLKAKKE